MILVIDNYDSFVYNLARYLDELGYETMVVRNDAVGVDDIRNGTVGDAVPEALVLSPGPCDPERAGVSLRAVRELGSTLPILGVCLGHQAIGAAYGGRIVPRTPVHGRSSPVYHDAKGVFSGLPNPFRAGRYHSLVIDPARVPPELEVSATTDDGTIMAVRHRRHPVVGIQFHPESVLSEFGHRLLGNFLEMQDLAPRFAGSRSA